MEFTIMNEIVKIDKALLTIYAVSLTKLASK